MVFDAVKNDKSGEPENRAGRTDEGPAGEYGGDGPGGGDGPRRRMSGGRKAVIITAAVLALLCAGAAGAGAAVRSSDAIFPNVTVGGTLLGGMTEGQASKTLTESGWDDKGEENLTVPLPAGCQVVVNARQAGAVPSSDDAAAAAYEYGRDGGIFSSLIKYVKCLAGKTNITGSVQSLDDEYIRDQIDDGVKSMHDALSGADYNVDAEKKVLTVIKGAGSANIDADAIYTLVVDALKNGNFGEVKYDYSTTGEAKIDMNELHGKVCTEPEDASYDPKTGDVTKSVTGVEFDVAEAQKLWDAAAVGDTVEIPLTITEPKITTDDLNSKLFRDKLGSQMTYFKSSSSNRVNNIELAAAKINGVILNPGEEFSYNGTVGQRTETAGFKKAGAYANGEVVQEIGGGICQVSSTLYCAALYANLKISDRTCHYFPVDYLPAGLDATVSWKTPDFKFVNDRDYPIKLVANVDKTAKSVTIEVWGTDEDGSYVELKYSTWKFYDTKYPTVALGYKATTYRNVFAKDGTLISSTKEASSTYHYHKENIVYPSASPSPTPTAKPTATPTPTPTPASSTDATAPVDNTQTPGDTSSGFVS